MNKYEKFGKRYAKKENHVTFKSNTGKLYVYEPNGRSEINDEPDQIFDDWKEYTKHYIGKELRKKRLRKERKVLPF